MFKYFYQPTEWSVLEERMKDSIESRGQIGDVLIARFASHPTTQDNSILVKLADNPDYISTSPTAKYDHSRNFRNIERKEQDRNNLVK